MEYTFLVRGYASKDIWLWLAVLALIVLMLGGRWLITKLLRLIKKKKDSALSTQ